MKNKLTTIFIILIFVVGLSLLLYPTVANYWNSLHQSQVIVGYDDEVSKLEQETYDRLLAEAVSYNESLLNRNNPYLLNDEQAGKYADMLSLSEGGAMAYIEIPSIDVSLPVLHGTDDSVLSKAVGHLEWSSLPVGGESTHCVVSGHRGLPSSELLTNIDHLELGDVFYVRVLGEKLEYRVDNIAVVLPDELDLLTVTEGKDYLTLVTCTPYGINSHRLLVRGQRVIRDADTPEGLDAIVLPNEAEQVDVMFLVPVVLLGAVAVVFIVLLISSGKKKPVSAEKGETDRDENVE